MTARPTMSKAAAAGLLIAVCCLPSPSSIAAATIAVEPGGERLAEALATARPGDGVDDVLTRADAVLSVVRRSGGGGWAVD